MFCYKCGEQMAEGVAFCPKCGAKYVYTEDVQQPMGAATSADEPQQVAVDAPIITENTTYNQTLEENSARRKLTTIGRILMYGSMILLFFNFPISPAVLVAGFAIGTILSIIGAKRPLGFNKILEFVVAVILLVVVAGFTLSSDGAGDKYVKLVKEGTLSGYPQMTVGEAFDDFLENSKWESGLSDDNVRFVNVTGEALFLDEEVEITVQFIVDEKNGSFQYNACEMDGAPQNDIFFFGLIKAIYGD